MKQIICLSPTPWSLLPDRTQQLIARLKGVQVLFFEPSEPKGGRKHKEKGIRVRPSILVYTLPPRSTLSAGHSYFYARDMKRIARFIQARSERHHFRRPLLWVTSPEHSRLLEDIVYGHLLYDCDRAWPEFPEEWESSLAIEADVVFAASPKLAEHLAPCSSNVAVVPNGGVSAAFDRTVCETPLPLLGVSGPVLCHMGPITRTLDLSPLLPLAAAHPDWTVLLLGEKHGKPEALRELAARCHVLIASPDAMVEIPDYVNHSTACIQLLYTNSDAACVMPGSYYDALSSGKPMAVLLPPEMPVPHEGLVYSTYTGDKFAPLCEQAVYEHDPEKVLQRRRQGAGEDWNARAAEIAQILDILGFS